MRHSVQLQSRQGTQLRDTATLLVDVPSKRRPTWNADVIRARMKNARLRLGLDVKEAAAKAGMSHWNWYKKEGGEGDTDAFQPEQCTRFAEAVGAPTLFPLYDWDHADEIDERLGWDKSGSD